MILFERFRVALVWAYEEPLPSLGNLINDGAREMQSAAWMLLIAKAGFLVVLWCASQYSQGDLLHTMCASPRNRFS